MTRRQAKKIIKNHATVSESQLSKALIKIHGGIKRNKIIDILLKIKTEFSNEKWAKLIRNQRRTL